jgi:aryl-alcohol dehydrogenase-like predicted oxidoreductase
MNLQETSLKESIATLNKLKNGGKCRYIGLSEPSAKTLRQADKSGVRFIQLSFSQHHQNRLNGPRPKPLTIPDTRAHEVTLSEEELRELREVIC